MIEVICNDRLGKKIRVKCNADDTIGDLKKLLAAQTGTRPEKLRIQKWYTVYKDHITLDDYEIHDGMGLELYCARAPDRYAAFPVHRPHTHALSHVVLSLQTTDWIIIYGFEPAHALLRFACSYVARIPTCL